MKKTAKALIGIILYLIDFVLTGFVTIYLWNNIICQLFDLRTFTFWQGWAFSLIVLWFLPTNRRKTEKLIEELITDIIYTLIVWFIGFLSVTLIVF